MKTVKLDKAELNLFRLWQGEMNRKIADVQGMANEIMNSRLIEMARDKGLDLVNDTWSFDAETGMFTQMEQPKEVIPGRKVRKRPNIEPVDDVIDVEPEEPELPMDEAREKVA